ncbi:MAG: translation elongation factor Ts [Gemmatimonadales bacterium]
MTVTKISAQQVSELRARTGAGMMDCKRALEESGGDMEKAIELLRRKGQAKADKRADRAASEGTIAACIAPDGASAGLVELNSETDFVALTSEFQALAKALAREVAEDGAARSQAQVKDLAGKTGENVAIGRTARVALDGGPGLIESYVHFNGQVGVLLALAAPPAAVGGEELKTLAKDLVLHIASARPIAVTTDQVPAEVIERERRIYQAQVAEEGKPEAVRPKIVEGKVRKFYEERVLLEQPFVKDDKTKVRDLLAQAGKRVGGEVAVRRFARFEVGAE